MALLTTTIGAYPKPDFVKVPDWFTVAGGTCSSDATLGWASAVADLGSEAEAIFSRGTRAAVEEQVGAGIDIPTDGEIRRENYVHYHCRHLEGFDFESLTHKELRNGAYVVDLPTVRGPIRAGTPFLPHDWRLAQSFTDRPVKITMPGPMTIADTTYDAWYGDPAAEGRDVAAALNREVLALAEAGCRHIQIDEPLFARKPGDALAYGIENVERAFHGCPEHVVRTLHICCDYPDRLDNPDYPKADPGAYLELADALEQSCVMAISLEDAHRHNDLSLLDRFATTTVILGVVTVATSRVETVDEIRGRLAAALEHIDPARRIAAPDCGLGLLGRDLALRKLRHLGEAAHSL